jgi:endoglucanase
MNPTPSMPEPFVAGVPPRASQHFKRGINLGNRLDAPNEGDWGGWIFATDFPFIAARGFDHVRIPVRFSGHAAASAPYTIEAAFFERIDEVIAQALTAGLGVVLDLHAYEEFATDPAAEKERFIGLWAQIATRYRDLPETVAFEPFNEPHGELDAVWNDLLATAITTIRETNPQRLIVADSAFWADPSRLMELVLPDDANIMASVHLYEPKLFSFQGQTWMGDEYQTTGVVFPGPPSAPVTPVAAASDVAWAASWFEGYNSLPSETNPSGPATIEAQVSLLTNYAQSSGRHVYNGEWGPQDGGDTESRARLIAAVREACEAADVSWAIWEDTENMSLFDSAAGTWNTPLVDALFPL